MSQEANTRWGKGGEDIDDEMDAMSFSFLGKNSYILVLYSCMNELVPTDSFISKKVSNIHRVVGITNQCNYSNRLS